MENSPIIISFPIADRRTSFDFYTTGLGLSPLGEVADDGIPEPLQFQINDGVQLMLIPSGGFGWVVGNREVASSSQSETFISITADGESGVDDLVKKAQDAGATLVTAPAQQPWGYVGAFTDPDGHVWQVTAAAPPK